MDTQETIFYAYPIDEFHRTSLISDIIKAYESEDNQHRALPVLKLTAEELAYKFNEDSFNDTDYWLTAVRPHRSSFDERIENLRNDLINHIIGLMKNAGTSEVVFDEEWEEYTSVVWFDRHDFPYWSKVNKVGIYNEDILQITCEDNSITLYTNSDYGARDLSTLSDIAYLTEQTLQEKEERK